MGPNLVTGVLTRRGTQRHGEEGLWTQRDEVSSPGMLGAQKLEEGRSILPYSLRREHSPADTLMSYLWAPELRERTSLQFHAPRLVALWYNSPRAVQTSAACMDLSKSLALLLLDVLTCKMGCL